MSQKFIFRKGDADRTVKWPCKIFVPVDGGKTEEQELVARFRVVPSEEMAKIMTPANMIGTNGDLLQLDKCLVGFDGLKDADGNDVSDEDALKLFRGLPYAVRGLARGYWEMFEGRLPKN